MERYPYHGSLYQNQTRPPIDKKNFHKCFGLDMIRPAIMAGGGVDHIGALIGGYCYNLYFWTCGSPPCPITEIEVNLD